MKIQKMSDPEFENLLLNELDNIEDLELLIIKGHILIEYSLNKFINDVNDGGINIDKTSFTFHNKITISELLGLFKRVDSLKQSIIDVNKLRNQIAHTLSYEKKLLKKLIEIFIEIDEPNSGIFKENSDFQNFYNIVIAICGLIIGRKIATEKTIKFNKYKLQMEMKNNPEKFKSEYLNFEVK